MALFSLFDLSQKSAQKILINLFLFLVFGFIYYKAVIRTDRIFMSGFTKPIIKPNDKFKNTFWYKWNLMLMRIWDVVAIVIAISPLVIPFAFLALRSLGVI